MIVIDQYEGGKERERKKERKREGETPRKFI